MPSSAVLRALAEIASRGINTTPGVAAGPTPTSNWVVPRLVLCGDAPNPAKVKTLLAAGITVFVDLRAAGEDMITKYATEEDPLFHVSFDLAHAVASGSPRDVAAFLKRLLGNLLSEQRVAYIYCNDGHALTAIAASGVLAFVYGISGMKAISVFSQLHGSRADNEGVHQLLTMAQKSYLKDLALDATPIEENGSPSRERSPVGNEHPPHLPLQSQQFSESADLFQETQRGCAEQQSHHPQQQQQQQQQQHEPEYISQQQQLQPFQQHLSQQQLQAGHALRSLGAATSQCAGSERHSAEDSRSHGELPREDYTSPALLGPTGRKLARFESSHSGGGVTTINLFSGDSAPNPSPPRKGRALVESRSQDYAMRVQHHVEHVQEFQHSQSGQPHQPLRGPHDVEEWRGPGADPRGGPQREVHGAANGTPGSLGAPVPLQPHQLSGAAAASAFQPNPQQQRPPPPWQQQQHSPPNGANFARVHPPPQPMATPGVAPLRAAAPAESTVALPPVLTPQQPALVRGPTPHTNWVVAGRVLCGPQPHPTQLRSFRPLVSEHFDTFVVLTEEDSSETYVMEYERCAEMQCAVVHYPMVNGMAVSQAMVPGFLAFVAELVQRIHHGEKIYVHCKEGHGRTGMVVSALLAVLYKLPGMRAVNLCDSLHECRQETGGCRSPENAEQRLCIISLLK